MRATILVVALVVSSSVLLGGSQRLSMVVSPVHAFAPATLTIRVHVEPDSDNRAFVVSAESGGYYRSSRIQLDGAEAPRTMSIEMRNMPGGEYDVTAGLFDSVGHERAAIRTHIMVLGSADGR